MLPFLNSIRVSVKKGRGAAIGRGNGSYNDKGPGMTLGIRQRRAEQRRRWRVLKWLVVVGAIGVLGVVSYQTGAEISHGEIANLEDGIARLTVRERDLGERAAQLQIELAAARRELAQWQARYEADVPTGKARGLLALAGDQLDRGVTAERIGFMIEAAGRKLDCTGEPATRRFLVRTPIYRGANAAVTFAGNAITVTATGSSAKDVRGNPEAWFDPAEPVVVNFTGLGGVPSVARGPLPLHHTVLWNDTEYRFSIVAAEQRGFIAISADRCRFPGK